MFYCETCSVNCSSKTHFEAHLRTQKHQQMTTSIGNNNNNTFECLYCKKSFTNKSNLNKHMKMVCEKTRNQIEEFHNKLEAKYKDEVDFLKDNIKRIHEEYKAELERIYQRHDSEIRDYKKTIDKQSTQLEMLTIENRNLEIENTKLKSYQEAMAQNSYNNHSFNTNSNNTLNNTLNNTSNHIQNTININSDVLNQQFPNVPSIDKILDVIINDDKYKLTDKEINQLTDMSIGKNRIKNFSSCLYHILCKRSIKLHYEEGILTDEINFPMVLTDINRRSHYEKDNIAWVSKKDDKKLSSVIEEVKKIIAMKKGELINFTKDELIEICNCIYDKNYFPNGKLPLPTRTRKCDSSDFIATHKEKTNIVGNDVIRMVKRVEAHNHFSQAMSEHPDFQNYFTVNFQDSQIKRLPLKDDLNFLLNL